MNARLLAASLLPLLLCSCSPGPTTAEFVRQSLRQTSQQSAREFIEEKSPAGRPLPLSLATSRAIWFERLQVLKPGMPECEVREIMSGLGAYFGANMPQISVFELDDDWSVALAWTQELADDGCKLLGWRLYGFPEWAAALPTGDIELVCAIRHVPLSNAYDAPSNPVKLLRVVNEFIAAGQDKTLAAIQAFHQVEGPMCRWWHWPDGPFGDGRASLLIACLFTSRDGTPFPPKPYLEQWYGPALSPAFPNLPVVVEGDLPFVLPPYQGPTMENPIQQQIYWAEKHGVFRQALLSPAKNPAKIADDLIARLPDDRTRKALETDIWIQALAAGGSCFPGSDKPEQIRGLERDLREIVLERLRSVRMQWDASSGKYLPTK